MGRAQHELVPSGEPRVIGEDTMRLVLGQALERRVHGHVGDRGVIAEQERTAFEHAREDSQLLAQSTPHRAQLVVAERGAIGVDPPRQRAA